MNCELLLVERAEAAVERIIAYLGQRSPQGARGWCKRWEEVLADVRSNPLRFEVAPESREHGDHVRQVLFKTHRGRRYRALFTVVGRGVYIIDVRGPGQNLVRRNHLRRGK